MKRLALAGLVLGLIACSPSSGPQSGSQTNWLVACESSADCGDLDCVCGACTATCESDDACGNLPGSSCVGSGDSGSIALCDGQAPPAALCLPRCDDATCPAGTSCVAGVCAPAVAPTVAITIDAATRYQTLAGFGASLAYAEDAIVEHPDKAALYDLVFRDSGLDVLRIGNRYQGANDQDLLATSEIVSAATERLGRAPLLLMTSPSPPAALKANGSTLCTGDQASCTLRQLPEGGFDYAGFADHWRTSLDAYTNAGITLDYVSIQNNPNWAPPEGMQADACRFLPEEGTTTVTVDGAMVEVEYPGYREALAAVRAATADLVSVPRFAAPETTGPVAVGDFVSPLGASDLDAVALHLYGADALNVDVAALESVRELARALDRPVFQTEMQAEGLETAILVHHALVAAGASLYLQNDLVALTPETASVALALLTPEGIEAQAPYHALSHWAKSTDPGWVRVDARSDGAELLSSAWLSADERALTVVLVNGGSEERFTELLVGDLRSQLTRTTLTRTVFDGLERSTALGELPEDGVVSVPGRSIITVTLAAE